MAAKKKTGKKKRQYIRRLPLPAPEFPPEHPNQTIEEALLSIRHALRLVYLAGERSGIETMSTRIDEQLKKLGGDS